MHRDLGRCLKTTEEVADTKHGTVLGELLALFSRAQKACCLLEIVDEHVITCRGVQVPHDFEFVPYVDFLEGQIGHFNRFQGSQPWLGSNRRIQFLSMLPLHFIIEFFLLLLIYLHIVKNQMATLNDVFATGKFFANVQLFYDLVLEVTHETIDND